MTDLRPAVDVDLIRKRLQKPGARMKLSLLLCARCGMCAESCFLYRLRGRDPRYMPSLKAIETVGRLYAKKGRVTRPELEEMRDIAWKRCVLCMRCACPLGVDIPAMIGLARSICRSQGVYPDADA